MKKVNLLLVLFLFSSVVMAQQKIDKKTSDQETVKWSPTGRGTKYIMPVDPAKEAALRQRWSAIVATQSQINQGKNLEKVEKTLLGFKSDSDLPSKFSYYFALAQCQEKLGRKKSVVLESYRAMYKSSGRPSDYERHIGLYALCALDCSYTNEARLAVQECIDQMREHPAYGKEYEYITDVPVTSNADIIRAHVYLLLSRGISHWDPVCDGNNWPDNGGSKTQEYLKKAIALGRNSTPNAYLKMAEYTRWSAPEECRKYLESAAKLYKAFPMHSEKAKEMLKGMPASPK
jgi:hypothetical protein